ncbi:MAG: hypothetical protein ACK4VK_04690 [Aquificaceae bacterium]
MMESALKLYDLLEKKLGKEEAKEFAKALEEVIGDIGELKKQETKKELTQDLATKQDIRIIEAQMKGLETEIKRVEDTLRAEIRRLEAYMRIMIVLLPIAIALYNPIFAQLIGLKP